MRTLLVRLFLHTIGRLSDGVRLCVAHGPTSGVVLDYAYRNEPGGRLGVGKWIDRRFLRYPGWEAVRRRRAAVQAAILQAAADLRGAGLPVRVLDIASGPAEYLLDVLRRPECFGATAVCRDTEAASVAAGNRRAAALGLTGARFEVGDALDRDAVVGLRPPPTLAVSVGLYELIDDDAVVARSVGIVAEALAPGGYFVVVHQASHPDTRFVSRVFRDGRGRPLRLTPRPAARVESWLREAGLRPVRTIDCAAGWYSLVVARKEAAVGHRAL